MPEMLFSDKIDLIESFLQGNIGMYPDNREMILSICEQYRTKGRVSEKQEKVIGFMYPKISDCVNQMGTGKIENSNPLLRDNYLRRKQCYANMLVTENHPNDKIRELVELGTIPAFTLLDAHRQIVRWINNEELKDLNETRVNNRLQPLIRLKFIENQGWFIPGKNRFYLKAEEFTFANFDKVIHDVKFARPSLVVDEDDVGF